MSRLTPEREAAIRGYWKEPADNDMLAVFAELDAVRAERDAALAKVDELEVTLDDEEAAHQGTLRLLDDVREERDAALQEAEVAHRGARQLAADLVATGELLRGVGKERDRYKAALQSLCDECPTGQAAAVVYMGSMEQTKSSAVEKAERFLAVVSAAREALQGRE